MFVEVFPLSTAAAFLPGRGRVPGVWSHPAVDQGLQECPVASLSRQVEEAAGHCCHVLAVAQTSQPCLPRTTQSPCGSSLAQGPWCSLPFLPIVAPTSLTHES